MQAENIIKTVDSYHPVITSLVGKPIPVTVDYDRYMNMDDIKEVSLKQEAETVCKDSVLKGRKEDRKIIQELKEKEKILLSDTTERLGKEQRSDNPVDVSVVNEHLGTYDTPLEEYIMCKVKKAQLVHLYSTTSQKMKEIQTALFSNEKRIITLNKQDPTLIKKYHQKYMDARKEAGLKNMGKEGPNLEELNFMRYLEEEREVSDKPLTERLQACHNTFALV